MPSAVAQESKVLAEQPLDNVKPASGELERDESLTAAEVSAKVSLNDPVISFVLAASLAFRSGYTSKAFQNSFACLR